MATFIEVSSEEEQCLELAKLINKALSKIKEQPDESFLEQCASLVNAKEIAALVEKNIDELDSLFTAGAPDKEIENFTFVVLSVMKKLGGSSQDNLCSKFVNKIALNPSGERSNLRLRLLNHVYTVMGEDSPSLFHIVLVAIQTATKSKQPEVLLTLPHFKDLNEIEKHSKEWGIDVNQQRQLFKSIRELFKKINRSKEAHKWTTKYLSTFKEETAQTGEEGLEAALEAIKLPDLFQFDGLLELVPIKQLEKTNPKVFQLLKIFVSENLDSFVAFTDANPTILESLGLNKEECTTKMRYLSLATLCAANTKVPYSLIAKTLQVDQNDVENWVVNAMCEEILDAKLDQMKGIVIINRCLQRVFTINQWKVLQERLNLWTGNIETMLKVLQETKAAQPKYAEAQQPQLQQTAV